MKSRWLPWIANDPAYNPNLSLRYVDMRPDDAVPRNWDIHFRDRSRILGIPEDESRDLIQELTAHIVQPRFTYTHNWRQHDLVVWDNRTTLHKAERYDMTRYRRVLRRIDEAAIFLMIAGSYTPFTVKLLPPDFAVAVTVAIWIAAIAGAAASAKPPTTRQIVMPMSNRKPCLAADTNSCGPPEWSA